MLVPRAVAVVIDGSRALLMKRYRRRASAAECARCEGPGPQCPGHHSAILPGGHVEDGESLEEAVLRELAEETTLEARIDRLLWTGSHNGRPASYFLMTDVTGVPTLSGPEAQAHGPDNRYELTWAAADEFDRLNLHPADVREPLARLLDQPDP